jgi:adenylate kinase family enzyme
MTRSNDAQKILITGMPYSGKSYVSAFLKKKGMNVVDADSIKGLGKWFDKGGNIVDFPADATKEWLDSHNFLWDENYLRSWLAEQKSTVYIFGLSANILELIDLFDKSYYLDVSPEVLQRRFTENERTNPMGQSEEQQAAILNNLVSFTKKTKEKGLIFVRADQSPEEIYKIVSA